MYTRCPSCRAEISFEPPANAASLPEGYKHKIKCPSCGVTIGVKIPRPQTVVETQPTFVPEYPNASHNEVVFDGGNATPYVDNNFEKVPTKRTGRPRNVVMFALSIIFIALCVLSCLVNKNIIKLEALSILGIGVFDGIGVIEMLIKEMPLITDAFSTGIATGIVTILPLILFAFACINAIVSLVSFIGGKYSKAWNFIASLIIAGCTAVILFRGILLTMDLGIPFAIADYFTMLIDAEAYLMFVGAGLGVVQLLCSLIFFKSMKAKNL